MRVDLTELLKIAQETAVLAGNLAREKWDQPLQVNSKGYRDLVTDADTATQKLITDVILGRFPGHGFLTEEDDSSLPTAGPIIWIIDPIDGTTNYSRQQPIFCISIAAARPVIGDQYSVIGNQYSVIGDQYSVISDQYEVLAGAIYDPMREELFSAAAGQGATLNGRPIRVSHIAGLSQAIISLDWSHLVKQRQSVLDAINQLAHQVYTLRALGSAALALAWVAAGRYDGYFNLSLKPWDVAAAGLIIREAGGQLSDVRGQPLGGSLDRGNYVASNGRIHQPLLKLLQHGN